MMLYELGSLKNEQDEIQKNEEYKRASAGYKIAEVSILTEHWAQE